MLANANREQTLVKTLSSGSTSLRLSIFEGKKITDSFCQPHVDRFFHGKGNCLSKNMF